MNKPKYKLDYTKVILITFFTIILLSTFGAKAHHKHSKKFHGYQIEYSNKYGPVYVKRFVKKRKGKICKITIKRFWTPHRGWVKEKTKRCGRRRPAYHKPWHNHHHSKPWNHHKPHHNHYNRPYSNFNGNINGFYFSW